jgi:hypothetical protein
LGSDRAGFLMDDHRPLSCGHDMLTIEKAFGGFHAFDGSGQGLVKVDGTFT